MPCTRYWYHRLVHLPTIAEVCVPRASIFDQEARSDTVLDLTDLAAGRIDADHFFSENYVTQGMQQLLELALKRVDGNSRQGAFKLRQEMGGGKTHNLVALGLLARHAEKRAELVGDVYPNVSSDPVEVVAFTGRQNTPLGIWGEIACQLGAKEHFSDYYAPLDAPGQEAWVTLLRGRRVVILLDELPPLLDALRAIEVGQTTLAHLTVRALSNLLVAINRDECSRVCLVLTDLASTYQIGSGMLADVSRNLGGEIDRVATPIVPVDMQSDDLFEILRVRLFEHPQIAYQDDERVEEVARAYSDALAKSAKMGLTAGVPHIRAQAIRSTYPFHPSTRDLYARFRENEGFQQTRGMLRLMRAVVRDLWDENRAAEISLIGPQHIDLNDEHVRNELMLANRALQNAIAKDIADRGRAVAERVDADRVDKRGPVTRAGREAQELATLLLVSSLANVPNAVIGLGAGEIVDYLAQPGRDVSTLGDVLELLARDSWYLHGSAESKLYYKNVQNLNSQVSEYASSFSPEQIDREIKSRLEEMFRPESKDCYQRLLVYPGLDEITLSADQTALAIVPPGEQGGVPAEILDFFAAADYKNRLIVLTGARNTQAELRRHAAGLRAVNQVIEELEKQGHSGGDIQVREAGALRDRIVGAVHGALREAFTEILYPYRAMTGSAEGASGAPALHRADFQMRFENNRYRGEEQVIETLASAGKYIGGADVSGESFQQRVEDRLLVMSVEVV